MTIFLVQNQQSPLRYQKKSTSSRDWDWAIPLVDFFRYILPMYEAILDFDPFLAGKWA
jgi:hypothetical protein